MDYQTELWEKYLVTGDWSQSTSRAKEFFQCYRQQYVGYLGQKWVDKMYKKGFVQETTFNTTIRRLPERIFWAYGLEDRTLNPDPAQPKDALLFANSIGPDQLASKLEANWPGSALFGIQWWICICNLKLANCGWQLEVGVAS